MNQKLALLRIAQQLTGIDKSDMQRAELNIVGILIKAGVCKPFGGEKLTLADNWERMRQSVLKALDSVEG